MLKVDITKQRRDFAVSVSFALEPGSALGLFGASGSGKSTVLHCIAGLEQPDDGHVRQGTQERDVLARMMRRPERGVRQAGTHADNRHGHIVIADIDAYLLQATRSRERRDRVDNRPKAVHRQPCRDADHVRFGNAAVEETLGAMRAELVEQAIADIARQQHDALVGQRQISDLGCECVSHATCNSTAA